MSAERPSIESPKDANLFASVIGEDGSGYIITGHQVGDRTFYNFWRREYDGTHSRVTNEESGKGNPQWEVFYNILVETTLSLPDNTGISQLLNEVDRQMVKK